MKFYTGPMLILLELFIKVYSADNSTQVYFVEIQIESGAYSNFTTLLQQLRILSNTGEASVTDFSITTECEGQKCKCNEGNSWSDRACIVSKCCKNDPCNTAKSCDMCLSDKRVNITGSFTVDEIFTSYLEDPNSEQYQEYSKTLTEKMKAVYSTLNWFKGLDVTGFSQGSVIVEYSMLLTAPFQINQLEDRAIKMQQKLNASNFMIVTTGYVSISIEPKNELFQYKSSISITCSTPESIGNPVWLLNGQKEITNGNEARINNTQKNSTLSISSLSEVWNGTFTCDYMSPNFSSILNRGSINVYVSLLPEIITLSDPQFPDCTGSTKLLELNVFCIILNTTEIYNITWSGESVVDNSKTSLGNNLLVRYQAKTKVYCNTKPKTKPVECQFQNRAGQKKIAALNISIINEDTKLCYEDNDWPKTPENATAIQLCDFTSVGLQTRFCNITTWANVTSQCVDKDLQNILDDAKNLQKGLGIVAKNANTMFTRLKNSTENSTINTPANVNASVEVMVNMNTASRIQNSSWNVTVLTDFLKSSSNLLNKSVIESWNNDVQLGIKYLSAVEEIVLISLQNQNDTVHSDTTTQNVQLKVCNKSSASNTLCTFEPSFNVNISEIQTQGQVVQTAFRNLAQVFPDTLDEKQTIPSNIMVSVNSNLSGQIKMTFNFTRTPNHELHCVYLDVNLNQWSTNGCKWIRDMTGAYCSCDHLTSFSVLMAKYPIELMYKDELTLTGLAVSIISLTISLVIEFLVWNTVVKSNISHFRHTVLVNIMLCLLVADASFVASQSENIDITNWCLILAVMQHFCFLAAFFWMLCLSMGLLHQVIFVFVHLRKKVYLGLSFSLGYVCPFIIVMVTIVTYNNGAEGYYYRKETCWLTYDSFLKGSIHSFVLPIGVIVFVNIFSMVVVISRILKPTVSEGSTQDEKEVLRSIVKAVVFLTPTLGVTWILGFCLFIFDLTNFPAAQIVNYAFIFFNSFQGFFILLTGFFGEKKVRDALLKRFRPQKSVHHKSESATQSTSATKRK